MKKLLKEPFLHFIIIGAVLFAFYGLVNKDKSLKDTIVINDFDINNLISTWEMQWKRAPTEEELQKLVDLNIKQEVFYQEALKMNLDHNDEIIKRRLAQKMQFLSNDIASMVQPTTEDLQDYLNLNKEKYLTPYIYSVYQIIFSSDNREDPLKDAVHVLKQFPDATIDEMKSKGDKLPFNYQFIDISADDLGSQLGSKFSEALVNQVLNKWTGPLQSGFGYHLVYITEKKEPQLPDLQAIKREVTRDYEYDYQNHLDENIYKELKKQYTIQIDINSKDFDPKFIKHMQEALNN
jgi:hypothetical protein